MSLNHRTFVAIVRNTMQCLCVLLPQPCPTLCDPMDCSPTGSSVHGILQARILEWVVIPFSRRSPLLRVQTHISYISCIGSWVLYHQRHVGSPWEWNTCSQLGLLSWSQRSLEKCCWVWSQHRTKQNRETERETFLKTVLVPFSSAVLQDKFLDFSLAQTNIFSSFAQACLSWACFASQRMWYNTHSPIPSGKAKSCSFVQSFSHSIKMCGALP